MVDVELLKGSFLQGYWYCISSTPYHYAIYDSSVILKLPICLCFLFNLSWFSWSAILTYAVSVFKSLSAWVAYQIFFHHHTFWDVYTHFDYTDVQAYTCVLSLCLHYGSALLASQLCIVTGVAKLGFLFCTYVCTAGSTVIFITVYMVYIIWNTQWSCVPYVLFHIRQIMSQ